MQPEVDETSRRVRRIHGFIRDVTDWKQAEAAQRESEARTSAILAAALDGVITVDETGCILELNPAAERMLGFKQQELAGRSVFTLFKAPCIERHGRAPRMRAFLEACDKPVLDARLEATALCADGSRLPVELAVTAIELHDRELFTVFLRDITARKQFEQVLIDARKEAEELSRLKSAFLNNMSHEIRTPLTAIIGFSTILARETDGEHQELATLIEDSGKRLLNTLNSILDLSMLEAGSLKLRREWVNVVEVVEDRMADVEPLAREKNLPLVVEASEPVVEAYLDRTCLSRILTHLLDNAIKFTEKGEVRVRVSTDGEQVVVSVVDTGIGISDSFKPHLFDAFKQESDGLTRVYRGSGLGLAVTQRLVHLMKGTITAKSRRGQGSIFEVVFPVLERTMQAVDASSPEERPESGRPRLLVVEDSSELKTLLNHMLKDEYDIASARNGDEALAFARHHACDLVLMDINLREERTGVDVMTLLRQVPGYRDVPIVAMTAYALFEDRERFLQAGFDGYVSKPFTTRQIKSVIEKVLLESGEREPELVASPRSET